MYRENLDIESNIKTTIQKFNEELELKIFNLKESAKNDLLTEINKLIQSDIDNVRLVKSVIELPARNLKVLSFSEVKKLLKKNGFKFKVKYFNLLLFNICRSNSSLKTIIHFFSDMMVSDYYCSTDVQFNELNDNRIIFKAYW